MRGQGFTSRSLPNQHAVLVRNSESEWVAALKRCYRNFIRNSVYPFRSQWRLSIVDAAHPAPPHVLDRCMDLYCNVHNRAREVCNFPIPDNWLKSVAGAEGWELLLLTLSRDEPEVDEEPEVLPSGFLVCNKGGASYVPLLVGIDYDLQDQGVYRLLLFYALCRARELGFTKVDMGMTAEREKKRLGCYVVQQDIFFRLGSDAEDNMEGLTEEFYRSVLAAALSTGSA